ncbi:Protein CBG25945 [Caenorhabditis briggsae]|uniref:Protein CBG25945 n=1 Tax=Caenorhabditis briggsae TaxID=6238 RepID=B6IK77_CAEBR|nr:Protein CBG25945 [Caenorhabditis briggsae]CAS00307.1 Protein CBG25945 [Caenorhabditis briggsae]
MSIRTPPESRDNRARPDGEVEPIQLSMDSLYPGFRTPNEVRLETNKQLTVNSLTDISKRKNFKNTSNFTLETKIPIIAIVTVTIRVSPREKFLA